LQIGEGSLGNGRLKDSNRIFYRKLGGRANEDMGADKYWLSVFRDGVGQSGQRRDYREIFPAFLHAFFLICGDCDVEDTVVSKYL
jgi:hypothetical protein